MLVQSNVESTGADASVLEEMKEVNVTSWLASNFGAALLSSVKALHLLTRKANKEEN